MKHQASFFSEKPLFFPPVNTLGKTEYILSEKIELPLLPDAYYHGYFPWPDGDADFIPWAHPLQRGMMKIEDFHIPKNVCRLMKQKIFELRIDTAVEEVIRSCSIRPNGEDTWITEEVITSYLEFHKLSFVHTFEAWDKTTGTLAGGLYGVSIGGVFAGESMFYRKSGASKYALACLGMVLKNCSVKILDTQMVTPVTEAFGARYYPREEYYKNLCQYRKNPLTNEELRSAAAELSL